MTCTLEGRCFCNAVRYRITNTAIQFYYCECKLCRKLTGSIAATHLRLEPAAIEWLSGENEVRVFRAPTDTTSARRSAAAAAAVCRVRMCRAMRVQQRLFAAERPDWAVFASALPAAPGFAPL